MPRFDFNPYIYGPPVKGTHFYGRANEIGTVLNTNIKQILFIAVRRAGKTSLLHQLSFLCNPEINENPDLCIFWSLEGIRDAQGARKRLASRSVRKRLKRVDWSKVEGYESCVDALWEICEAYETHPVSNRLLLLIDEPDLFNYLSKRKESAFLYDIKAAFDEIPNLRVIMVSPPRIIQYSEECDAHLLDNFQRYYLSGLTDIEAEQLIRMEKMEARPNIPFLLQQNGQSPHLVQDILELSNNLPFYIQQICGDIFSSWKERGVSEIFEEVIESQKFSDYYVSDFRELHPIEKFIALILSQTEDPLSADKLIQEVCTKVGEQIAGKYPTIKFIDNLVKLGILKKIDGHAYHLANSLFDGWLARDFRNLWHQAMSDAGFEKEFKGITRTERIMKTQDFEKLRADIESISYSIKCLEADKSDHKITPEFFYSKQASLFKERVLLFLKLKRHLGALGAHELAELLEVYARDTTPEEIMQAVNSVRIEANEHGWGNCLTQEIAKYGLTDARAILSVAYQVAERLIRQDR